MKKAKNVDDRNILKESFEETPEEYRSHLRLSEEGPRKLLDATLIAAAKCKGSSDYID
jgi:hypothetical protein